MRKPHSCAVQNTVVGTVASASFLPGLTNLARSAKAVGFPCVVVQAFDWFDALLNESYAVLPVPSPPLLPRQMWCNSSMRHQYGWRRSQLYRVRLWRVVVEKGLDLLAMDLDHQLAVMNPVPFFTAVHAPPETISHNPVSESSRKAAPADVVAVWDGPGSRYLNVGIMWMRSTPATLELARRSENRSWVGWEQQIFNEELNFNKELSGVRCCHTICLKKFLSHASNASAKLPKKSGSGTGQREQVEGTDRCNNDAPGPAAYPPHGSAEAWANSWTPNWDVLRSKHSQNRKYGRCNHEHNVCVMVNPASGEMHHTASFIGSKLGPPGPGGRKTELPPGNCSARLEGRKTDDWTWP
jgi:hypothetical protein